MTLFAVFCSAFAVTAQDMSWMDNSPEKYLPAMTREVVSRTSACNQGEEAFMDFIPKFRTDKSFRDTRVKFDKEDQMSELSFKYFDNFAILKASKKNTRCDKSYGTWYNVSANEVCFRYDDVLLCSEAGGGSVSARFQRIDGKWYITALMVAG